MTAIIAELYDALLSAGAPEEKARKAAQVVAESDTRSRQVESDTRANASTLKSDHVALRSDVRGEISDLRAELSTFRAETKSEFTSVRGDLTLLKWMFGVSTTLSLGILLRVLFL